MKKFSVLFIVFTFVISSSVFARKSTLKAGKSYKEAEANETVQNVGMLKHKKGSINLPGDENSGISIGGDTEVWDKPEDTPTSAQPVEVEEEDKKRKNFVKVKKYKKDKKSNKTRKRKSRR